MAVNRGEISVQDVKFELRQYFSELRIPLGALLKELEPKCLLPDEARLSEMGHEKERKKKNKMTFVTHSQLQTSCANSRVLSSVCKRTRKVHKVICCSFLLRVVRTTVELPII
jgi:hypothetical protein